MDTTDGSTTSTMHTNGGKGFPFNDAVVTQPGLTCNGQKDDGLFNLTVAVSNGVYVACSANDVGSR